MHGLYISQINHGMNEETKMAPSQCVCADGFKSLLHKYAVLPLDSSQFRAWLEAWPWGNRAKTLELVVWIAILHWYLGFHCLGSLWPGCPRYQRIEYICLSAVIQSALAERASAFLWRSALLMNLCSEVLFLCLHQALLWIKFRGDVTLVKYSMERWWTRMRIPPFKKCR